MVRGGLLQVPVAWGPAYSVVLGGCVLVTRAAVGLVLDYALRGIGAAFTNPLLLSMISLPFWAMSGVKA